MREGVKYSLCLIIDTSYMKIGTNCIVFGQMECENTNQNKKTTGWWLLHLKMVYTLSFFYQSKLRAVPGGRRSFGPPLAAQGDGGSAGACLGHCDRVVNQRDAVMF